MQREHRLRRRNDFKIAFNRGKSYANREFVVYIYRRSNNAPSRLGISVSKKIGNAVVRNRIRRLLKEIVRDWLVDLKPQRDLIVIARKPAADMNYNQVKDALDHLFKRAKLFNR